MMKMRSKSRRRMMRAAMTLSKLQQWVKDDRPRDKRRALLLLLLWLVHLKQKGQLLLQLLLQHQYQAVLDPSVDKRLV